MENKLFTIVNKEDEARFLADLNANPDNFKKKLIFVFGNSENYIVVNGEKFLHKPESAESTAVDLGLPSGLKWATCNVGASKPEDEGLLFQFGRVNGYKYGDTNHKFRIENLTTASGKLYDKNEILDLKDDVAHVYMGGAWRMPTQTQYSEMFNNTSHDVVTVNGVQGMLFTSKINRHQMFIPFIQGIWYDGNWDNVDKFYIDMWSSQVHASIVDGSYLLYCSFCSDTSIG